MSSKGMTLNRRRLQAMLKTIGRFRRILVLMALLPALFACGDESSLSAEAQVYRGWVVIYRNLQPHQTMPGYFEAQGISDDNLWVHVPNLTWSSEGTRVDVLVDGQDTGYEVELAEVVYTSGPDLPVLKLAVYHEDFERALGYTWAPSGSKRIGINLRWIQAGLTRQ